MSLPAPYDLPWMAWYLSAHAVPGSERWDAGRYAAAVRTAEGSDVVSLDFATRPGVVVVGSARGRPGASLLSRVRVLLDLDADGAAVAAHLSSDPAFAPVVATAPGIRVPGALDGWELLLRTMVGQQISLAAARTHLARLVAALGEPVEGSDGWRLVPSAATVAERGPRGAGRPPDPGGGDPGRRGGGRGRLAGPVPRSGRGGAALRAARAAGRGAVDRVVRRHAARPRPRRAADDRPRRPAGRGGAWRRPGPSRSDGRPTARTPPCTSGEPPSRLDPGIPRRSATIRCRRVRGSNREDRPSARARRVLAAGAGLWGQGRPVEGSGGACRGAEPGQRCGRGSGSPWLPWPTWCWPSSSAVRCRPPPRSRASTSVDCPETRRSRACSRSWRRRRPRRSSCRWAAPGAASRSGRRTPGSRSTSPAPSTGSRGSPSTRSACGSTSPAPCSGRC